MNIRISGIVRESVVDGPGVRYVVFAQGCAHNCIGCHNPSTHDFNGGYSVDADELIEDIRESFFIDGVTFSGGDPFYQTDEFSYIAEKLKKESLHIVCYTGFEFEEILNDENKRKLLENIDILIDGPFVLSKKNLKLPFRGSDNQRIIDVKNSLKEGKIITLEY